MAKDGSSNTTELYLIPVFAIQLLSLRPGVLSERLHPAKKCCFEPVKICIHLRTKKIYL